MNGAVFRASKWVFPPFFSFMWPAEEFFQEAPARQIVGSHGQYKYLVDSLDTADHDLPDPAYRHGPAETLLDAFSFSLRDGVAWRGDDRIRYGTSSPWPDRCLKLLAYTATTARSMQNQRC